MEGNNTNFNSLYNTSYSYTTEEDPRILATSHLMYKIGILIQSIFIISCQLCLSILKGRSQFISSDSVLSASATSLRYLSEMD